MRYKDPLSMDRRIIKRFLFLPMRIKNEVRWLEFANIKQYYFCRHWRNECFVDYSKE